MKIVYIVNAFTVGGAQKLIYNLVEFLKRKNWDIYVIAFRDGELRKIFNSKGVKTYLLECDQSFILYYLYFILKKIKPDIVHAHLGLSSFFTKILSLIYRKPRYFSTMHGIEKYRYIFFERYFKSPVLSFVVSKFLKKIYGSSHIVLYPGVEAGGFHLKLKSEIKNIAFVGRVSRRKGILNFLNLAFKLRDKFNFYIKGKIVDKVKLPGFIAHEEFSFSDFIWGDVDLLVFPSRFEGLGLVILEAMANCVPVIALNSGGVREIIVDRYNGFLVKNIIYDRDVIKIVELLNNLKFKRYILENACNTVKSKFNFLNFAEKQVTFYLKEGLCGEG